MDLIYMNGNFKDIGVMKDFKMDLAYGYDENNFVLTTHTNNHVCNSGYFFYIENTEYGGIIDGVQVSTEDEQLMYIGRSWHGILASQIVVPDANQDYLILSGGANRVIELLLSRQSINTLFKAKLANAGKSLTNYKFHRYVNLYKGIKDMLESIGMKLIIRYKQGFVELSAVDAVDYSQVDEFDRSQIDFDIYKKTNKVNHIIILGSGQLKDRVVHHYYVDANGNISATKHFSGIDEVTAVYENTNAEGQDLIDEGIAALKELNQVDVLELQFDAEKDIYDIGDIVGARENITNINLKRKISKKILLIENNIVKIEYEVS